MRLIAASSKIISTDVGTNLKVCTEGHTNCPFDASVCSMPSLSCLVAVSVAGATTAATVAAALNAGIMASASTSTFV